MNKGLFIIVFVSLVLALASCCHSCHCDSCSCSCDRGITVSFLKEMSQFTNYSFVKWDEVASIQVWTDMADWQHPDNTGFNPEIAQEMWSRCQNTKAWIHKESIPVRSFHGPLVNQAIDALESGFDSLFSFFVSQDYYLRWPQDAYNEIIPSLVDSLVTSLRVPEKTLK